jgi:biotin-(acetyl-CoA carboxylase) ligase
VIADDVYIGQRVTVADLRRGVVFSGTVDDVEFDGRVIVVDDQGVSWRVGAGMLTRADG